MGPGRRAPITGSGPSASPPWARRPRCEPGCAPRAPWRRRWATPRRRCATGGRHPGSAPRGDGPDAAVTWLGPPFAPSSGIVRQGVARAAAQLAPGNGGAVPGTPWRGAAYWTPATASFALAAMAAGDRVDADQRLDWLLDHRTALGAFPERVRRGDGAPRSAAPLAWTDAIVLLTLASGDRPLPIPGT